MIGDAPLGEIPLGAIEDVSGPQPIPISPMLLLGGDSQPTLLGIEKATAIKGKVG